MNKFLMWCIPAVLGIAAAIWFGVYIEAHHFNHQLSQEDRAAVNVGAAVRPTAKIVVETIRHDCTTILNGEIDGRSLLLYGRNDCHHPETYTAWHWRALSPDGTVIASNYENWKCPKLDTPGLKMECRMDISDDDRISKVQVWTSKDVD